MSKVSIYEEYSQYTQKYKKEYGDDTIVLIEVGSFWEIYDCDKHLGADMKVVSDLLNIQISKKNKSIPGVSASNPLMAGFPSFALPRFLPMLLDANITVILVSQTTPPPNPERRVTHVYSKGTYIENLDSVKSNYIMSVIYEMGVVGISLIDLSNGSTFIFEGKGTDELYKFITIYNPCEIIVLNPKLDLKFNSKQSKIHYFEMKNYHRLEYKNEILAKAFDNLSMLSIIEFLDIEKKTFASTSLTSLIDYCIRHNPSIVCKLKKPVDIGNTNNLNLYYNCVNQLDVDGLNTIINKAVTSMGKRYFKHRLFHPYSNKTLICDSLQKIKDMKCDDALEIRSELGKVYDLERLFRKVQTKTIQINEFESIYISCKHGSSEFGREIQEHIESNIDFETNLLKGHDDINNILQSIENIKDDINKIINDLNAFYNVNYFRIEKSDKEGYYIPITTKRKNEMCKTGTGKEHCPFDTTLFKNIGLNGGNNLKLTHPKFDELGTREERLQKQLVQIHQEKYIEFVINFYDKFNKDFQIIIDDICEKDFTSTCVYNKHRLRYEYPNVLESSSSSASASFKEIRHPIIEQVSEDESYIGNDIDINCNGILLYGLNASGKSSLMKAVGLNIIMAQSGMCVAATRLDLCPYESLFCRISKNDNLYLGHSTFMVEMLELRKILNNCNNKSLVLADELCSGTEFTSAISIVASGIYCLAQKQCAFIFATHLHELTRIEMIKPYFNIFHLDVYFDREKDILVYNRKLMPGQGSELYGLEVCKSLDMDSVFIETADKIRSTFIKTPRKTKYNSKKIVDKCQICDSIATEVHHIQEQHTADKDGYIGYIHKNRKSNLVSLCEVCHTKIHQNIIYIEGYKKTNNGLELRYTKLR